MRIGIGIGLTAGAPRTPPAPAFTPADLPGLALFSHVSTATVFLERSTTPTTPATLNGNIGAVSQTGVVSVDVAVASTTQTTLKNVDGALAAVSNGNAIYDLQAANVSVPGELCLWAGVYSTAGGGTLALVGGPFGASGAYIGSIAGTFYFITDADANVNAALAVPAGWSTLRVRRVANDTVYVRRDAEAEITVGARSGTLTISALMSRLQSLAVATSANNGYGAIVMTAGAGTGAPAVSTDGNVTAWLAAQGY